MAGRCFRCAGAPDLEHARDCPHRTAPPPPVVPSLPWPRGYDGKLVSLERAIKLTGALDETAPYWVEFDSTNDPKLDAELVRLEENPQPLGAIQRYCQHYRVGAFYGDDGGVRGAVTSVGVLTEAVDRDAKE